MCETDSKKADFFSELMSIFLHLCFKIIVSINVANPPRNHN